MLLGVAAYDCGAQDVTFSDFIKAYNNLTLPVKEISQLHVQETINPKTWNKLAFDIQSERAKFYGTNDSLYKLTTYGRIPEEPFGYETWKKENGEVIWYEESFDINAFPIGRVDYPGGYIGLVNKVIGFEKTYYDLYVFNQVGKLLSAINLHERRYKENGDPDGEIEAVYLKSNITKDGQIVWHQERYGVTTDRTYELMNDGYFRIVKHKSEGEFDY